MCRTMRNTRVVFSVAWSAIRAGTWSAAWSAARRGVSYGACLGILATLFCGASGCDTLRARARAQKGVDEYREGNIKGAAELFREAAEIDPTVPPILINRGFTHLQLYQQNPRSKEGIAAANLAIESFKQYMQMPGLKPEQRQRARDYLLQTFVDARRYDEAVEYFKPQVERENPDIEALTILGNIAKSIGKSDASRIWLERRVKANPKDTDGYVALAIMNWDELCADSQCRIPPDQQRGNFQNLSPEQRFKKANEGIEYLKKAIELSPQAPDPVTYANLLLIQRSWAQPNPELRTADLDQAKSLARLSTAMRRVATGAKATPEAAANPDAGAPADNIKVWSPGEAVQAVKTVNTTLPPACPPPPPPAPTRRGKPPEPPPPPAGPCIPATYFGIATLAPPSAAAPSPAAAPAAPSAAPAAPSAPAPAAAQAAPAPAKAAPSQATPPPVKAPAPAPAAKAAPAPTPKPKKAAASTPEKPAAPAAPKPAPVAPPSAPEDDEDPGAEQ